jgi:hypothetical protein
MISDTLSDAIDEIENYLVNFPENYRQYEQEIRRILVDMESLRRKLDQPPSI